MRHGKHSEGTTQPPPQPQGPSNRAKGEMVRDFVRGRERQVFGLVVLVVILIAALSILGASLGGDTPDATGGGGGGGGGSPDEGPANLAAIRCTRQGAEVENPEIVPQTDGVHLRVRARRKGVFHAVSSDQPDVEVEARVRRRSPTELTAVLPPGDILVGCFQRPNAIPDEASEDDYTTLTVQDPESLWTTTTLACDEPVEAGEFTGPRVDLDQPPSYELLAVSTVPGLGPNDDLVTPGYPQTRWPFTRLMVLRDEGPVAEISFLPRGRWNVQVVACPDAGIGEL